MNESGDETTRDWAHKITQTQPTNACGISDLSRLTNMSLHRALEKCGFFAKASPMALVASTPKLFPLSWRVVRPSHSSICLTICATVVKQEYKITWTDGLACPTQRPQSRRRPAMQAPFVLPGTLQSCCYKQTLYSTGWLSQKSRQESTHVRTFSGDFELKNWRIMPCMIMNFELLPVIWHTCTSYHPLWSPTSSSPQECTPPSPLPSFTDSARASPKKKTQALGQRACAPTVTVTPSEEQLQPVYSSPS